MDIQTLIGLRIRELRTAKNLTQEAIGFSADFDRSYINHIESGRRNISLATLEKILVTLGISFAEFFNDEKFSKK